MSRHHAVGRKVMVWSHWNDFNPYQNWQDSLTAELVVSAFMNVALDTRWIARAPGLPDLLSAEFALYRIYSPGLDLCLHEPCRRHAVGRMVII